MTPILLYQPPGAWGLPSVSPFCLKLETWLRMAELPFEVGSPSPTGAPKGKFPYVEVNGETIADSHHIIERLTRDRGVTLDEGLSPADAARGWALRRMLEEGTYFILVYERWLTDEAWATYRPFFLSIMPPVLGYGIVPML